MTSIEYPETSVGPAHTNETALAGRTAALGLIEVDQQSTNVNIQEVSPTQLCVTFAEANEELARQITAAANRYYRNIDVSFGHGSITFTLPEKSSLGTLKRAISDTIRAHATGYHPPRGNHQYRTLL
ncbi:MAG: hypothetical protein ACM3JF_02980 [Sphaerimonospora mesophila]